MKHVYMPYLSPKGQISAPRQMETSTSYMYLASLLRDQIINNRPTDHAKNDDYAVICNYLFEELLKNS